jgi:hypothetical protein
MSGPALNQWESHSSIHESALGEARELTELLGACLAQKDMERALEVAYIAVEHWETRTLRHAEAEEDGLYAEISKVRPDVGGQIIALTRDHALMRNLLGDIKAILAKNNAACDEVLQRFQALILVDMLHNQDEEKIINTKNA